VAAGRLFQWQAKAAKAPAPIYSLELLPGLVIRYILGRLDGKDATLAELKKPLPPHIRNSLKELLEPLVQEKKVKWHPPFKGRYLSLRDPNPLDFLSPEIRKLLDKGKRLGFSPEAVSHAVQQWIGPKEVSPIAPRSASEIQEIIFQAMKRLKPAASTGALVYLPDLRDALREVFRDKDSFDQAILKLAETEEVQLQSHSLPAKLSEEERRSMIDNGRGSYFMAIGIRME